MAIDEQLNVVPETEDTGEDTTSYEVKMLKRCQADYENAKQFLKHLHDACVTSYEFYHNAGKYEDLKKKKRFPMPFFQEQVDTFAAYLMDKLFYKDQPARIIARDNDTKDADVKAKQQLMAYQDSIDNLYGKIDQFARDVAMYRICVAQVDYEEKSVRRLVGKQEPITQPDEMGQMVPILDGTGQPMMQSRVVVEDVPVYKGPKVKRIDPIHFFITQDKESMDDGQPIMIRSYVPLSHFKKKPNGPNFINYAGLKQIKTSSPASASDGVQSAHNKRMLHGYDPKPVNPNRNLEYIEWFADVDKAELYAYLGKPLTSPMQLEDGSVVEVPAIAPDEQTCAIIGWVGDVLARVEEMPIETGKPNIVVGIMQQDENELIGTSLADKVCAVAYALDVLMGMMLENFKQSINAGHVIKKTALITGASAVVNEPGWTLETNEDVRNVHARIEPGRVAPDIYLLLNELFPQLGQDAGGIQDILSGRGEVGANTLGETQMVATTAGMRLTNYLRTFERSFIEPLWTLRNQINIQFLDSDYLIRVLGDDAQGWVTVTPDQIRANVEFVCEASARETNRLVITQQLIQTMPISKEVMDAGFPVRLDKQLGELLERGFSMSAEKVKEWLPSLTLEEQGIDINAMLIENMMMQMQMKSVMAQTQAMQGQMAQGMMQSGQLSQPRSEEEASASLEGANTTQVGRS